MQSHLEMAPKLIQRAQGGWERGVLMVLHAHGGGSQVLHLGKDTLPGISGGMEGDHMEGETRACSNWLAL